MGLCLVVESTRFPKAGLHDILQAGERSVLKLMVKLMVTGPWESRTHAELLCLAERREYSPGTAPLCQFLPV